jgi:hypothetical protein
MRSISRLTHFRALQVPLDGIEMPAAAREQEELEPTLAPDESERMRKSEESC